MTSSHRFHPTLLRAYDIRGIVGETLSTRDAWAIGAGYGTILRREGGKTVAVGRDGRLSSTDLHAALVEGLAAAGIDVIDVGLGPTPMLYFAVHHCACDGGIQVTGSHNPPDYNGFKMMIGRSSFYGERIRELGALVLDGALETSGGGSVRREDIHDSYVTRLLQDYRGGRPIDVVWDAGNGAAGPAMRDLAAALPGRHACLFAEIDGTFPNHHPDPTVPENLERLIEEVRDGGFELGIAFDGDGDRIGVVDSRGRIVYGDQILQILARDLLGRRAGEIVIADVKASQALFDDIAAHGGRPLMWKTGHSLIKAKMSETGSPLAGEMSGHIFYGDGFYGHDDALYVAVRLLDVLARHDEDLASMRDGMPHLYNTPEIRFDCPEERKFETIAAVRSHLDAAGFEVNDIDGVRVRQDDGWWLLRASNTQAVLVARAEAASPEGLVSCKRMIAENLGRVGLAVPEDL